MLPPILQDLRIPVVASPMFIVSGPDLVIAQCKAGIVGSFPALNARESDGEPPLRPLLLFARPEAIQVIAGVPDGPPARFVWRRAAHAVVRAEGPERIAMEWWRPEGQGLTRDYFRVEDEHGLRFWLYRDGLYDREFEPQEGLPVRPVWYMHGLFA